MLALLVACHHAPPDAAPAPTHDATVHHGFDDVERWVQVFDDPARDAWQKPAELVAAMGLREGEVVADVGAGTGYLEPHLARAVGASGKVIAEDIEPALVDHLRERAAQEGLAQVEARLGQPADPGLTPEEVDAVVILDTWHHIDDRVAWATRLKAAMKPGGELWVVDFDPSAPTDQGPPPAHRIPAETVEGELAAAGWTPVPGPPADLLPYQYVRGFTPAIAPRPFTAEQIRDAMGTGTLIRLRFALAGEPAHDEIWRVTASDADGCTIASTRVGADGQETAAGEETDRWDELMEHATFPADATAVSTGTVTVPAGTFETKRYVVTKADGTVSTYDFAPTMPGPPISLVITAGGSPVFSMTLVERTWVGSR